MRQIHTAARTSTLLCRKVGKRMRTHQQAQHDPLQDFAEEVAGFVRTDLVVG